MAAAAAARVELLFERLAKAEEHGSSLGREVAGVGHVERNRQAVLVEPGDDADHAGPAHVEEAVAAVGLEHEHDAVAVGDTVVGPVEVATHEETLVGPDREGRARAHRRSEHRVGEGVHDQHVLVGDTGALGDAEHLLTVSCGDEALVVPADRDKVLRRPALPRDQPFQNVALPERPDLGRQEQPVGASHFVVGAGEPDHPGRAGAEPGPCPPHSDRGAE